MTTYTIRRLNWLDYNGQCIANTPAGQFRIETNGEGVYLSTLGLPVTRHSSIDEAKSVAWLNWVGYLSPALEVANE